MAVDSSQINSITHSIVSGEVDEALDDIQAAVVYRRQILANFRFDELRVGDKVMIDAAHIKPRYLDGAEGTVVEKRVTKIEVQFGDLDIAHDPYGKWSNKKCIVGAAHVKKIEE